MSFEEIERLHAEADEWLIRSGARVLVKEFPNGACAVKVTLVTGAVTEFVCTSDDEYRIELVLAVDTLRT